MPLILFILFILFQHFSNAQSPWPSESWNAAINLTPVMNAAGLTELSSLYWNDHTKRLYITHGDGRLRVLQLNTATNSFSQIANVAVPAGPEGVTMVNESANEFYTIDEDNYQIRKFTHGANYTSVALSRSWNILAAPSPMTNTGNTGPEGIAFIPDSFLIASGFVSQATGLPYASAKGMGGLLFIAHQNQGYVWVFDVNPNVSNDFAYVGKYKTNKTESCDLAFDKSTGLLYILHNTGSNTLEAVTLASSAVSGGDRKLAMHAEYVISNPSGNINIEGFAISPKCSDSLQISAWLCRDVESVESSSYKQDCIRWFQPFQSPGNCIPSSITLKIKLYIEGLYATGLTPVLFNAGLSSDPTACDSITVLLYKSSPPYALLNSFKGLLHTNGILQKTIPVSLYGESIYIAIKPRNGLETWSKFPMVINAAQHEYIF